MSEAHDTECTIGCTQCGNELFRVERVPTGNEGVFENRLVPLVGEAGDGKTCPLCARNLERML